MAMTSRHHDLAMKTPAGPPPTSVSLSSLPLYLLAFASTVQSSGGFVARTLVVPRNSWVAVPRSTFREISVAAQFSLSEEDGVESQDRNDADDVAADVDELDCIELSEKQILNLRREVKLRSTRNALARVSFPADDAAEEKSLMRIAMKLKSEELVEVRGLSTSDKKTVYDAAEDLAEMFDNTIVIQRRGHSCVLFRPRDDGEGIRLWTTRKLPWKPKNKHGGDPDW